MTVRKRTLAAPLSVWISTAAVAATGLVLAGCPPAPTECESEFVGDPDLEPEIQVVYRGATGGIIDAEEGGDLELFRPPQGGKVFLAAARVRNIEKCGIRLQAALIDDESGRVIAVEGRPWPTRVTEDGWLEPLSPTSLSSFANVPACPAQAAERRIDGNLYTVHVVVEDRDGRRFEKDVSAVPRCVQPGFLGEQCRCECSPEYSLGDRCEEGDGGLPDAGPDDAGPNDGGAPPSPAPDAGTSPDGGGP